MQKFAWKKYNKVNSKNVAAFSNASPTQLHCVFCMKQTTDWVTIAFTGVKRAILIFLIDGLMR